MTAPARVTQRPAGVVGDALLESSSSEAARNVSLQTLDLTKRYADVTAVDGVSLGVDAGSLLTVLGPSGSGKSTILHLIAGLVEPTAGSVRIGGQSVDGVPAERRNVGMVFQNYALFPHLTVAQNLAFPLEMRRVARREIRTRVAETIDLVQLRGLEARLPQQLSGGEQQRVALARALIYEPRVLLLDEPLAALDRNLRQQLQLEIKRLHADLGLTVLYVTHDQAEAMMLSDAIAVLDHGRVIQTGSPVELYSRPRSRFVATFLGEANLVPVVVVANDDAPSIAVRTADGRIAHGTTTGDTPKVGDALAVLVRPEDLLVEAARDAEFDGTVASVAFLGDALRIDVVARDGTPYTAKRVAGTPQMPTPGDRVLIGWSADRATIVH